MSDIIYNNLKNLIEHHDSYFDEDIAQYLIGRIDKKTLTEHKFFISHKTSYHIEGNLWSYIAFRNKDAVYHNLSELNKESKASYQKYQDYLSIWENVIRKNHPNIEMTPVFFLKKHDKKYQVSLNLFLALDNLYLWYKLQNNDTRYSLSSKEEKLLVQHLLDKNFNVNIYGNYLADVDFSSWIVRVLNHYMLQKKNNESLVSQLLDSENMKSIIRTISISEISGWFSEEQLKQVVSKTSQKSHLFMLSYLLPLASAEKWVNIIKEDNEAFDFISFIMPLAAQATGLSKKELTELMTKGKFAGRMTKAIQHSVSATKELEKILDYFKDNIIWSDEIKTKWYTIVLLLKNDSLYKSSRAIVNLPEWYAENNKQNSQHIIHSNDFKVKEHWMNEQESEYQAEELEKKLIMNENSHKKPKL